MIRSSRILLAATALLVGFTVSSSAHALPGPFYLDVNASGGIVSIDPKPSSDPSITQLAAGVSVGFHFVPMFFVGVRGDYETYMHSNKKEDGSDFSGKRTSFSPMVGLSAGPLLVKLDYQFMGDYTFDEKTLGLETVYTNPSGFRIEAAVRVASPLYIGLKYQTITFGKAKIGSIEGEFTDDKPVYSTIGAVFTLVF